MRRHMKVHSELIGEGNKTEPKEMDEDAISETSGGSAGHIDISPRSGRRSI
jgi:hypothetical protein